LFEFKPTLNNKSFYWLGLMGIDVGRWARLVTGIIYLGMLCLFYLYTRAVLNKEKWTDVGFIFGLAGILCSMCDNIFFGGSWDYIYLKPLFVFDMKDLYLNCFAVLILVSFTKNKAKIKNVKIKDIISLAKNSQTQNQDEKNATQ
jgi:lipoprotein signal peptidase